MKITKTYTLTMPDGTVVKAQFCISFRDCKITNIANTSTVDKVPGNILVQALIDQHLNLINEDIKMASRWAAA